MPLHPVDGLCPKGTARAHRNFTVTPFARCSLANPPQNGCLPRSSAKENKNSGCETVKWQFVGFIHNNLRGIAPLEEAPIGPKIRVIYLTFGAKL